MSADDDFAPLNEPRPDETTGKRRLRAPLSGRSAGRRLPALGRYRVRVSSTEHPLDPDGGEDG